MPAVRVVRQGTGRIKTERLGGHRLDKDGLTLGLVRKEVVDFARRTVVCDDSEALVVHVEDQVLTLDVRCSKRASGKG